jgi:Erv1 / Alr family
LNSSLKLFLGEVFKEVVPVAKDYVMVQIHGDIDNKKLELLKQSTSEQLLTLKEVGAATPPPAPVLERPAPMGSPLVDPKKAVGRAIGNLLYTRVRYYPDAPSPEQQEAMRNLVVDSLVNVPCQACVLKSLEYLDLHPVDVGSKAGLEAWLCSFQGSGIVELGPPTFSCAAPAMSTS